MERHVPETVRSRLLTSEQLERFGFRRRCERKERDVLLPSASGKGYRYLVLTVTALGFLSRLFGLSSRERNIVRVLPLRQRRTKVLGGLTSLR